MFKYLTIVALSLLNVEAVRVRHQYGLSPAMHHFLVQAKSVLDAKTKDYGEQAEAMIAAIDLDGDNQVSF